MDLLFAQGFATSLLLHVVRVGAFFAVVPLFGRQADSMFVRLVLSTALGSILWWVGERHVGAPASVLVLGVLAVREAFIGMALGFALSTLTSILISAGEVVSTEMGFALARTINPESGVDATVVSQLFQVFGFLLLLQFDVHHEALRVMESTFHACPIGKPFAIEPIFAGLHALVGHSLELALRYAFPVLGLMLLLTAGTVLLGRAVPAINLMEFAFGLRVLVALGATGWFLVQGAPWLVTAFGELLAGARAMFPH